MRIQINFSDLPNNYPPHDNFIIRLLRKRYEVELSPDANYLFFSCFGYDYLAHKGIRIFFTTENMRPNFDLVDYALGFDHISFGDRYIRLPLYRCYERAYRAILGIPNVSPDACNRDFCSYVVSNRRASRSDSNRAMFFHKLSEYKRVASGGKQFNNVGGRVADKMAFVGRHKFNIAFENTSTPGYTTEKIVEAKAAGSVPIYWGNPLIANEFNPKAFINCHDYPDLDSVVSKVASLDQDNDAYLKMLAEPLFPNGIEPDALKEENYLCFFEKIFQQPLDRAYRRVLSGRWGTRTERIYKRASLIDIKYQTERLYKGFVSKKDMRDTKS